jgi:predicted RNase H-like nuclease (RuvC/YqgF family)
MRSQTWLRAGVAAAVFCFAATAAFTQQQSQSSNQQQTGDALADAARKAQEAKKTAPKPKKVYTEDDISTRPATQPAANAPATGSEAPAASSPAGQGTEGQAATSGDTNAETPEQKWRKRFQAQRDKIAQAEKELEILQREHDKSLVQYYPDPQKALTQQYNRQDINKLDTQIAAKTKEIASLKQQLSDMEDELRKEGGDPGWAR